MNKKIIVAGPSCIDHTLKLSDEILFDGTSAIKQERKDPGGTGLCYAIALARLGSNVQLHSRIGNDDMGKLIKKFTHLNNVSTFFTYGYKPTDHAYVLLGKGNHKVVASAKETTQRWKPNSAFKNSLKSCDCLVITSFPNHIIIKILDIVERLHNKPFVVWAPHAQNCRDASVLKAKIHLIDHISLSKAEFQLLNKATNNKLTNIVQSISITKGAQGVDLVLNKKKQSLPAYYIETNPIDTNGAGEAFGAAYISAILNGHSNHTAAQIAAYYAYKHLEKHASDFPKIKLRQIEKHILQSNKGGDYAAI